MPAPPLTANTGGAGSAIGSLTAGTPPGAGGDQVQAQLQALVSQIRDLGQQVDTIGSAFPQVAPEAQQIKTLLKAILVKAAQVAPAQTASGMAVPGGGA